MTTTQKQTYHTLGPWKLSFNSYGVPYVNKQKKDGCEWTIASLGAKGDERKANANLIVSAPDLLAACKLALKHSNKNDMEFQYAWSSLEKAIAKAEGKTL